MKLEAVQYLVEATASEGRGREGLLAPYAVALQGMMVAGGVRKESNVSARFGAVGVGGWSGYRGGTRARGKNTTGRLS
jgi:hypothetical protein